MRHRVPAHHHRGVGRDPRRPRVRHRAKSRCTDDPREILVRVHERVPVVAHDPQLCRVPPAALLGVGAQSSRRIVHDAERVVHERVVVPARVRRLVHARERDEQEVGPFLPHAPHDDVRRLAVDVEPPFGQSAEVRERRAQREARRQRADAVRRGQPARDHAQRREAVRDEIEDRRGASVEVVVEVPHLMTDVAARVVGPPARLARAVVPAKARDADRAGKPPDEEGRVGRSRYRRKDRRHAMQRALVAQSPKRGQCIEARSVERVGTCTVGDENDYRHAIRWSDDMGRRKARRARRGKSCSRPSRSLADERLTRLHSPHGNSQT